MSRFGFWHGGGLPQVQFLGYLLQDNGVGNFNSKTFTGVSLGGEAADREFVMAICVGNSGFVQMSITNITVNGYSYSNIGTSPSTASAINFSVMSAVVPAPLGSSGDVKIDFSGNIASLAIGLYSVKGRNNIGANHIGYGNFSSSGLVSTVNMSGIDIPQFGFAISCITPVGSSIDISGAGFATDARPYLSPSGGIYGGMAHAGAIDFDLTGGGAVWSQPGSTSRVAAALWVFGR